MITLVRRRKATTAELMREQQRQARVDAPTLRQFLPAVAQVWVELAFDTDARLVQAPRMFTCVSVGPGTFRVFLSVWRLRRNV